MHRIQLMMWNIFRQSLGDDDSVRTLIDRWQHEGVTDYFHLSLGFVFFVLFSIYEHFCSQYVMLMSANVNIMWHMLLKTLILHHHCYHQIKCTFAVKTNRAVYVNDIGHCVLQCWRLAGFYTSVCTHVTLAEENAGSLRQQRLPHGRNVQYDRVRAATLSVVCTNQQWLRSGRQHHSDRWAVADDSGRTEDGGAVVPGVAATLHCVWFQQFTDSCRWSCFPM